MAIVLKPLQCLTLAPEDYDYGWMRTIAYNVATDHKGRLLRLAENADEFHFKHQVMRYGSGLNLTYDTQSNVDDAITHKFLTENADPTPVYYHGVQVTPINPTPENYKQLRAVVHRIISFAPEPNYKAQGTSSSKIQVRIVGKELNESFLAMLIECGLKPIPLFDDLTPPEEASKIPH